MGRSDDLVRAAQRGDQGAWRELHRRHAHRLVVWLRTLPSGDWATAAEDLASEAWLTAAGKIADFHGSDDDFAGWLFTIARHHSLNDGRRARRRATDPVAVDDVPDGAWGSADAPDREVDAQDATRRLLAHLSPREAEVVACMDVVGLDAAATARVLGMKPTAVRVARHRALGRLRRVLDEGGTGV